MATKREKSRSLLEQYVFEKKVYKILVGRKSITRISVSGTCSVPMVTLELKNISDYNGLILADHLWIKWDSIVSEEDQSKINKLVGSYAPVTITARAYRYERNRSRSGKKIRECGVSYSLDDIELVA